MSDARITPDPDRITRRDPAQVAVPVSDLCRKPSGPRDRQLICGDAVTILDETGDWAYLQSDKDGYCGYLRRADLTGYSAPTHRVSAPATHAYSRPDIKSPENCSLSFASRLHVLTTTQGFAETPLGFVPIQHLSDITDVAHDPAAIAMLFLGTPYLWGGNSRWGIDCSGLVQAALLACGIPCPGDSDQQQSLGQDASAPYRRNDLLFWKGHVALVTDAETMIHATAHPMATVLEPIDAAIRRIANAGGGPVTAHRRLA